MIIVILILVSYTYAQIYNIQYIYQHQNRIKVIILTLPPPFPFPLFILRYVLRAKIINVVIRLSTNNKGDNNIFSIIEPTPLPPLLLKMRTLANPRVKNTPCNIDNINFLLLLLLAVVAVVVVAVVVVVGVVLKFGKLYCCSIGVLRSTIAVVMSSEPIKQEVTTLAILRYIKDTAIPLILPIICNINFNVYISSLLFIVINLYLLLIVNVISVSTSPNLVPKERPWLNISALGRVYDAMMEVIDR